MWTFLKPIFVMLEKRIIGLTRTVDLGSSENNEA